MQLDKQRIALDLEKYSEVFYHFWNYCEAEFTEAIPTAAVSFDKTGQCLKLSINPTFWAAKTYTQQLFILAHEMLHIYYKHGNKAKNLIKERRGDLMQIANVAMDLCVNRTLTTAFGFDRTEIDPENMFCWIDTVFKDRQENPDRYFEYYYNLIKDNAKVIKIGTGKSGGNNLVDDHGGLGEMEDDEIDGILKEIADKVHPSEAKRFIEKAGEEPKDDKSPKSKQAGTQSGDQILKVKAEYKPKRKWEVCIRNWVQKAISDAEKDNWIRPNRRMTLLNNGDFLLPSDSSYDGKDREKIELFFLCDFSGSCLHLADRFYRAANTIPLNRFNVRTFGFDTVVKEIKDGELTGFGGTSFKAVNDFVEDEVAKTKIQYPEIFIVTDGMGDTVKPRYPEKWHWFLSENYRYFIPKESNIYDLKDFE